MTSVRHWRPVIGVAITAVSLTVASMAWATLLSPTKVIGGKGNQILPSATPGATFLAFSSSRPGHPDVYDAYVKPAGQRKIKVNQNGQAFAGGISGQTLIYQHVRSGQSNIQEFDMVTHQHSTPPGVNTTSWEWAPYISGDWVMFGRINLRARPDAYRVILRNELTSETRVLQAHTGAPLTSLTPGGLDGDWLSWDRFTRRPHRSAIVRYQISTEQKLVLPAPAGKDHYSSTVSNAGDLFYARADQRCGAHVTLREHTPGGADTLLTRIPRGYDVGGLYAVDEGAGVTTVYFDSFKCSNGLYDAYKIVVS